MRLTQGRQSACPIILLFIARGGRPEIWSYGIRNPQGMAMNPWTDTLWLNEHGPRGVMRSIFRRRARTTAGRWRPMASTTAVWRFPAQGTAVAGTEAPLFDLEAVSGGKRDGFLRSADLPAVAAQAVYRG